MAGLVFLTLVCMAVYFLVIAPRTQRAEKCCPERRSSAANAQIVQQMTTTAEAALWTPTAPPTPLASPSASPVPITPTSSPTPVIVDEHSTVTAYH